MKKASLSEKIISLKECCTNFFGRNRCYGFIFLLVLTPPNNTGSVVLSWDANRESDLAGYKIYYGQRSRQYDNNLFIGNSTSYRIADLRGNRRYFFTVTAVDYSGNESDYSSEVDVFIDGNGGNDNPDGDQEGQVLSVQAYNFPNPFRLDTEATNIRYELFQSGEVTIEILDSNTNLVRRLIKNQFKSAGEHTEDVWDGRNNRGELVAQGVYFCRIWSSKEQRIIKIATRR